MVQELWAKVNPRERLVVVGAAVAIVAWLLGVLITDGWYGACGAQGLGVIAVVAAVAAGIAVYLRYAPNTSFTWPAPYPTVLLALGGVVAVVALIGILQAFSYDPLSIVGLHLAKPITLYVVAIGVLAGGAIMAWGGYQEYTFDRSSVPPAA